MRINIVIHPATRADEQALVVLSQELSRFNRLHHPQTDSFEAIVRARTDRARHLLGSPNPDQLILMAKANGRDVGYALALVDYPEPSNDNGTGLYGLLDEVYVEEPARGLGIGAQLIDTCLAWIQNRGAKRVKLHMYTWNTSAQRLYEQRGFVPYAISWEKLLE